MTPAQASGHPDFVTDVPVQGPTDEGMRAGSCWYAQHRLPARPECVDCEGTIPMWAQQVSLHGVGLPGFAVSGPGDPDVWTGLSTDQQKWIVDTLTKLNNIIYQKTGTTCPTWGPAITAAGGCFQNWFNANKFGFTKKDGSPLVLRTDGVFDQDTLDALRTVAAINPTDFPTAYPGTTLPGPAQAEGLSKGEIAGIAVGGATVLGGVVYLVTRKKKKRR